MAALRVAVDLTGLETAADGFTQQQLPVRFVEALVRHAATAEFVVLTRPAIYAALAHLDAANARRVDIPDPGPLQALLLRVQRRVRRTRFQRSLGWLQMLRSATPRPPSLPPARLAKLRAHVVLWPFVSSGLHGMQLAVPMVAAVHDLQHLSHPHLLSAAERTARAQAFATTCRRADRIVCSAASVRDTALQSDGLRAERVLTLWPGRLLADAAPTQPEVTATLARHGLMEHGFVLLVGDFEARHNHRLVLTAFGMFRARHPESELRLVCAGGPEAAMASFRAAAARMDLEAWLRVTGALADGARAALIQSCRALVVASLYETVGETVLAAMDMGQPVVCSQIPDLVELTAGAALMFDPHRPAELADAFERIDSDPALLSHLARLGRERVATGDDAHGVAQAYLDVLANVRTACQTSR